MSTLQVSREVQLKCTAGKGMFPHEAGVLIQGADRYYESFIDWEFLRIDEGEKIGDREVSALVPVQIIQDEGSRVLVELPRQVVSGGRRIWVLSSSFEAA